MKTENTLPQRLIRFALTSAFMYLALVCCSWAGLVETAHAATYTVTNTNDSGAGSLTAAIISANANPNEDTIAFNIPGSGVHTIKPGSVLPKITAPVTIDGYTQPGASANTLAVGDNAVLLIELDGSLGGGNFSGPTIMAAGTTIQGLVINRFLAGILIAADECNVRGNFIGTDPTGKIAKPNTFGVAFTQGNLDDIGWTTAADRNVISGNSVNGIYTDSNTVTGLRIYNNYIGVDATGTKALGNDHSGVFVQGNNHEIGGASPSMRNVISSNGTGIRVFSGNQHKIYGNYIGTNAAGNAELGNVDYGIELTNSNNTEIGAPGQGKGNLISGNGASGILIHSAGGGTVQGIKVQSNLIGTNAAGSGNMGNKGVGVWLNSKVAGALIGGQGAGEANTVAFNKAGILANGDVKAAFSANKIYSNDGLGIDLSQIVTPDGVTANDNDDSDAGPNGLQNYPELLTVESENGQVAVKGGLNSTDQQNFLIEFFANPGSDATGHGEGQVFIGSTQVLVSAGAAPFNVTFPANVAVGSFVSATATALSDGTTSEFSLVKQVTVSQSPSISVNDISVTEGNSGETEAVFAVTLSAQSNQQISVNYEAATGFAQNPAFVGEDFIATSGTLVFAPGETSKQVTVKIKGDFTPEPDEVFILLLTNPAGAAIAKNQGMCTILNDDSNDPSSFQFAQNVYATSEDLSKVTITVTRTGDLSAAASVDYETKDGNATERGEYTTALGTLHFAAGETQQSIELLISEDCYDELAEESLLVQLSNPSVGTLGQQSAATVKIMDDGPESVENTNDDAEMFVRQHYHDFLNREADAAGLAFWNNELLGCGPDVACLGEKRQNVSAAFFLSIEFQETGFLVHRLTEASFDKLPRYRDFVRDSREIAQGIVVGQAGWELKLEANKQSFINAWVSRSEFITKYAPMTNEQYVDALYANAAVAPESSERQALVDGLNNQTETRASTLRKVCESGPVMLNERNRAFVLMQYFGYLRRNPDDAPDANMDGYDFWLTKLNQFNGDFEKAEMVKGFLVSTEYRSRFGLQ